MRQEGRATIFDLLDVLRDGTPSQIKEEVDDATLQYLVPELMPQVLLAAAYDRDTLVMEQVCVLLQRRVYFLADAGVARKRVRSEAEELAQACVQVLHGHWPAGGRMAQRAIQTCMQNIFQ